MLYPAFMEIRSLLSHIGSPVLVVGAIFFLVQYARTNAPIVSTAPVSQGSSSTLESAAVSTGTSAATSTPTVAVQPTTSTATSTPKKARKAIIQATKSSPSTAKTATTSPNDILRIENPYTTPPLTFESINIAARAALVNIYCSTKTGGVLKPITGSGIMVDPRGVVLTNAHVAQYVLIAQSGKSDLRCEVRTGAPAVSKWIPVVMYIPSVWINLHASDIVKTQAIGTGKHDYALLYMASTVSGTPLPPSFAYVTPDPREAIGFVDDNVLVASYPVEFVGGSVIQSDLFPVSSITTIKQLLTFSVGKADALSLGGIIGAQSGSSGGGVVNQWNRLIGLITTTSTGATTGERDLHAISSAYIDRDLKALTGVGLTATLSTDPRSAADAFIPEATVLGQKLIDVILGR